MAKVLMIRDILKSQVADDNEKGTIIFNEIKKCADAGEREIILDFKDVELVNTAFLNNAIGTLFDKREFDLLSVAVKIAHITLEARELLRETISLARVRYGNA